MINHWKTYLNLWWIASCLMTISYATTTDFITGKSTYNSFSIEKGIKLGKIIRDRNIQAFEQEDIPINKKMVPNLENIVKVLAADSNLPNLPYNVNLIQAADIVNAAAAPSGSILVVRKKTIFFICIPPCG
jgi:predicted Zn-dependent protease